MHHLVVLYDCYKFIMNRIVDTSLICAILYVEIEYQLKNSPLCDPNIVFSCWGEDFG